MVSSEVAPSRSGSVSSFRDHKPVRPLPRSGPLVPEGMALGGGTVAPVRCPICASVDDKVVDSRLAEDGAAIRRRRECLACGRRFTTFERLDDVGLQVLKRSGHAEAWDRSKIVAGLQAAAKNRSLGDARLEDLALQVEEEFRLAGPEVPSERVGLAVLERLQALDEVAYLRFASVYKGFHDASDFAREVGLLTKATAPKPRP